jgi:acetyl-CoA C-acetyltransferase
MSDAVILSACRTPIGKFRGKLSRLSAAELGAVAVRAALERAGVPGGAVDDVIMGNVLSAGVGQAPARQAALNAGLPPSVSALTINKVCGSGLQAVMLAGQAVRTGDAQVVVAGGMESMSRAPFLVSRETVDAAEQTPADSMLVDGLQCAMSGLSMGTIAENLARADGWTRAQQDGYALSSHRKAVSAAASGLFRDELVAVPVAGEAEAVTADEGPRRDTTIERLSSLRTVFMQDGTVTAGNASMISDGAAALVVASSEYARKQRLAPLARILASATSGLAPEDLFVAPADAIRLAVRRAGLSLADIDLLEINEAFAVQMLACLRRLELSEDRVNVHGGAIALGHPIGASGARVTVTLLHAMRGRKSRYGVAALCLGGGNAVAAVFENLQSPR